MLVHSFEGEEDQRAELFGFSFEAESSTSSARHPPLERQTVAIRIASFARSRQLRRLEKVRSTPRGVVAGLAVAPDMGIEYNHFRQPADPTPGGRVLGPSNIVFFCDSRSRRGHLSALHHPGLLSDLRFTIFVICGTRILTVLRFTAQNSQTLARTGTPACAQL